jgi:hypothetical protein
VLVLGPGVAVRDVGGQGRQPLDEILARELLSKIGKGIEDASSPPASLRRAADLYVHEKKRP